MKTLHDRIKANAMKRNNGQDARTGACGPCDAEAAGNMALANMLDRVPGRRIAGEGICAEKPLIFTGTFDANGDLVLEGNSPITICPTRLVAVADSGTGLIEEIKFGNDNQLLGSTGIPFDFLGPDVVGAVPFVMHCLRMGQPYRFTISGGTTDAIASLVLLGPTIG